MRTQRIFGIAWLGLFGYGGFHFLRLLFDGLFATIFATCKGPAPSYLLLAFLPIILPMLVGAVASVFLFRRGDRWARIVVASLAALIAIFQIIELRHISISGAILCIFAIVSVILLLLPKHEPVA
jgi:hypothetical protein